MTTKVLDNKNCTFKILLSWRFPRKTAFWTTFLSAPLSPPPLKTAHFIFIVVSPSLICSATPALGLRVVAHLVNDRFSTAELQGYTPVGNDCEINSKNVSSCN